ncbi:F-box protein PP2-B1 [Capsella rubella]|nr:F-box protein PP2-B1 [Capsella rubella]
MEQIHGSRNNEIAVAAAARFDTLPEDCISKVISHTSPRDACVAASVSKAVKSAAQSDLVWETFLPMEYSSLVPQPATHSSKKEIFISLAHDSVLSEDGKKSFWLDKTSGKKCYMLAAMDLTIIWGDSPAYWQWITVPESKFEKVAELRNVCWFDIRGKISCRMLSEGTHYSVYIVFKRAQNRSYGFDSVPVEAGVGFVGKEATKRSVFLESGGAAGSRSHDYGYTGISHAVVSRAFRNRRSWLLVPGIVEEEVEVERESGRNAEEPKESGRNAEEPKERGDGWSEVELGKFYINNGGCDEGSDEIEISLMETENGHWKSGLIFQGFEIRPERRN